MPSVVPIPRVAVDGAAFGIDRLVGYLSFTARGRLAQTCREYARWEPLAVLPRRHDAALRLRAALAAYGLYSQDMCWHSDPRDPGIAHVLGPLRYVVSRRLMVLRGLAHVLDDWNTARLPYAEDYCNDKEYYDPQWGLPRRTSVLKPSPFQARCTTVLFGVVPMRWRSLLWECDLYSRSRSRCVRALVG